MRRGVPEAARFWPKVNLCGPVPSCRPDLGPCWIWTRYRNPRGYGQFSLTGGRLILAHVWAWQREHGPVPDGLELDHLCRNPACVRPSHLEAVTHRVNLQRGLGVSLKPPVELREACANGHLMTSGNVFLRPDRERKQYLCRQCARDRQKRYWERSRA